jgi:hypothetical protein
MSLRSTLILVSTILLATLMTTPSMAGPGYQVNSFITTPANGPKVLAAIEKLQNAPIMKKNKGRLLFLANLADGADPSTHAFVVLFKSTAEYEAFSMKLQADPAWAEFIGTLGTLGQGAGTLRIRTERSWGDISNDDVVWQNFLFRVHNPMAFMAAHERFMATKTGKAFPGQVHLTSVVAGGVSRVSHGIVVGYESQAEMEKWNEANRGNLEWAAFLAELNLSSESLGSNLSRTIKAWGPASMKSIVGQ